MLAAMCSQGLLVVLAPTIVLIGSDFGASVGAVGQARSVTAVLAVAAAALIAGRADRIGVARLLRAGGALAVVACAAVAAAPTLPVFLLAHVLVGVAFACLLSAGFAGAAAFPPERRAQAIGCVAAANALAWIVVTPVAGVVAGGLSWRAAEAVPAALALAAIVGSRAVVSAAGTQSALHVRALVSHGSARRWIAAEVTAYGAWAALLTFIGAFFVERLGVPEALAGWLLAIGAAGFVISATRGAGWTAGLPRRPLVAFASLLMAILFAAELALTTSVALAVGGFFLISLAAGIRTPASGSLGLEQLPGHPGAMMAARTAATQIGYLVGAVVGGAVITVAGYSAFGLLLAVGMVASAALMLRVNDPLQVLRGERCHLRGGGLAGRRR
jgi:predicted MFS family arabinose efflux permease